jgi:hypothetical protein
VKERITRTYRASGVVLAINEAFKHLYIGYVLSKSIKVLANILMLPPGEHFAKGFIDKNSRRLVTASPVMTTSWVPAGGNNYPENGLVKPPRRET